MAFHYCLAHNTATVTQNGYYQKIILWYCGRTWRNTLQLLSRKQSNI